MTDVAWQREHSVEAAATLDFAWRYWTDVHNWDEVEAHFTIDGPFADGAQGTTLVPGQDPLRWRIRDVHPGESYVIETELDRATLAFEWRFEALSDTRTRLTQRIVLRGDNAAAYARAVEVGFGENLPGGMERIAKAIADAEAAAREG